MIPRDRLNKPIRRGDQVVIDRDLVGRPTGLLTATSQFCEVLRFTIHGKRVVVRCGDDIGYIDPGKLFVMSEDEFVLFKLGDENWQEEIT